MFATGRIALAASAPVPTLPATAVRTEAGQTLRVGDRERQARRGASSSLGRRDDATGRVEIKTALPRDAAGARRALRQPEGRRAGAGEGADVVAATSRRGAADGSASAPRLTPDPAARATHVDHPHLDQQPGLRHHGDGRHHRARPLLVRRACASSRCRTSACRSCMIMTAVSGRLARGGRDRRHQADRVRGQPGVAGVKLIRSQLARGLEPGVRRVPARRPTCTQGDAGRARQDRASCGPSFPRDVKDPLVIRADNENEQPVVSLAVHVADDRACASSRRSPTRRSSRRSRTCRASRASTSTAA